MKAALEHIGLIEEAFKSGNVDEFVDGDFEDIQVQLGLIEKRAEPRPRRMWFGGDQVFTSENLPDVMKTVKKEKNKRKQEKKSRKKNRKR